MCQFTVITGGVLFSWCSLCVVQHWPLPYYHLYSGTGMSAHCSHLVFITVSTAHTHVPAVAQFSNTCIVGLLGEHMWWHLNTLPPFALDDKAHVSLRMYAHVLHHLRAWDSWCFFCAYDFESLWMLSGADQLMAVRVGDDCVLLQVRIHVCQALAGYCNPWKLNQVFIIALYMGVNEWVIEPHSHIVSIHCY